MWWKLTSLTQDTLVDISEDMTPSLLDYCLIISFHSQKSFLNTERQFWGYLDQKQLKRYAPKSISRFLTRGLELMWGEYQILFLMYSTSAIIEKANVNRHSFEQSLFFFLFFFPTKIAPLCLWQPPISFVLKPSVSVSIFISIPFLFLSFFIYYKEHTIYRFAR